jgi:hypothetical protein
MSQLLPPTGAGIDLDQSRGGPVLGLFDEISIEVNLMSSLPPSSMTGDDGERYFRSDQTAWNYARRGDVP